MAEQLYYATDFTISLYKKLIKEKTTNFVVFSF